MGAIGQRMTRDLYLHGKINLYRPFGMLLNPTGIEIVSAPHNITFSESTVVGPISNHASKSGVYIVESDPSPAIVE